MAWSWRRDQGGAWRTGDVLKSTPARERRVENRELGGLAEMKMISITWPRNGDLAGLVAVALPNAPWRGAKTSSQVAVEEGRDVAIDEQGAAGLSLSREVVHAAYVLRSYIYVRSRK